MFDVIVIGAGLTGLMTAYHIARAGARVKMVAKGLGATHFHAGTIDVLGYYPTSATPVTRPLDTLRDLTRAQPQHPYALAANTLDDALRDFVTLTRELGLPYEGATNVGDNLWLPSPVGAARPTFLAPRTQIAGDLHRTEPMLIVGFRGLRDFYPTLIAENLTKQGHTARAEFLPLDVISTRRDVNTVQLAAALDDDACVERLASALQKLVRVGERIGLPAILGLDAHTTTFERLQARVGAPIFEIPTLPPSVPGIRLTNALRNRLRQMGVRIEINADVIGFHAEGDRVLWIESEASGRPLKHRAEKFILATGGILGGGINSDHTGKVWEVVFNLPIVAPTERAQWFRARFFDSAGHPIFRA
ncbi:MAG: anaerobic glycerol-3-phosphate dehydrogenase subunit GlpB, partial [Anaerolineae bacterium]|nr:anaerobic glycerol-3-phosphate dehydrogenase subunit GlpB [Anaerolineae bacterium]